MALRIRKPWAADVLVMENMFILSDLAGGLVGGMGMAACGEIGDSIGQPAHGSAPEGKANPLAAILLDATGKTRICRRRTAS